MTEFKERWERMSVVERIAHIQADWAKCRETDEPMVLRIASAVAHDVCRQAADEIERLRKERDEARLAYCREVLVLYGDADEQYRLEPAEIARRKGWSNLLEILTGSPNRSPNRSEVAE